MRKKGYDKGYKDGLYRYRKIFAKPKDMHTKVGESMIIFHSRLSENGSPIERFHTYILELQDP
jgi:hypothetical protein